MVSLSASSGRVPLAIDLPLDRSRGSRELQHGTNHQPSTLREEDYRRLRLLLYTDLGTVTGDYVEAAEIVHDGSVKLGAFLCRPKAPIAVPVDDDHSLNCQSLGPR